MIILHLLQMTAPVKYPLHVLPVFPSAKYRIMFSFILVLLDRDGFVRMRYELFGSFFNIWFNYIYNSDFAEGTRDLQPPNWLTGRTAGPIQEFRKWFLRLTARKIILWGVCPVNVNHPSNLHSTKFPCPRLPDGLNLWTMCCCKVAFSVSLWVISMKNIHKSV